MSYGDEASEAVPGRQGGEKAADEAAAALPGQVAAAAAAIRTQMSRMWRQRPAAFGGSTSDPASEDERHPGGPVAS